MVREMRAAGEHGSIVTLLCDSGERYAGTYFDDAWVAGKGWEIDAWQRELAEALPAR